MGPGAFTSAETDNLIPLADAASSTERRQALGGEGRSRGNPASCEKAIVSPAELAGIMAAKQTAALIPLCHPLPLSQVSVSSGMNLDAPGFDIQAEVRTTGKTGVEMEALTAVSVAALTLYDMLKAVDKTMHIEGVEVTMKSGGKSDWPAA